MRYRAIYALCLLLVPFRALASTWPTEGTEFPMTPQLEELFSVAAKCPKVMTDGSEVFMAEQDAAPMIVIFIKRPDGTISAYADMIGERLSLDYCLQ